MPNQNYIRGRQAEYYFKNVLEKQGYTVTRAAASKGTFDLVGLGPAGAVGLQAKRGQDAPPRSEWEAAASAHFHPDILRFVVWIPDAHVSGRIQPRVLYCSHPLPAWCVFAGWQEGLPPKQLALRQDGRGRPNP